MFVNYTKCYTQHLLPFFVRYTHPSFSTLFPFSIFTEEIKFLVQIHFQFQTIRPVVSIMCFVVALPASDHWNGVDGWLFIYCLLYSEREHSIINRTLFCCQTIFVLPNNIHERICINQPHHHHLRPFVCHT